MSIKESLDAWSTLSGLVNGMPIDEELRKGYLRSLEDLLPKMIEGLQAEVRRAIEGPPVRPAQPVRPVPAGGGHAGDAPPQEPLKPDYPYDDWARLAEANGRNPADFVRTWFRDIEGGFDSSTAAQRVDQYAAARRWLAEQRAKESAPRPKVINGGGGGRSEGGGKVGPCPECGGDRQVKTKYGWKYRCDDHDYWGRVS